MKHGLKISLLNSILIIVFSLGFIKCKITSNNNDKFYLKEISRIDSLNEISLNAINNNTEFAKTTASESLEKAQIIKYTKGIADANRNLAIIYRLEGEYEESFNCSQLSLYNYEELKDEEGITKTYNNLGIIYKEINDFDQALEYYTKIINTEYIKTDSTFLGKVNINIANIELENNNYNKAIELYNKPLTIFEKLKDTTNILAIYLNVGECYRKSGELTKAQEYYKKCERLSEIKNNQAYLMHAYHYTGELLLSDNQFELANLYLIKSFKIANELNRVQTIHDVASNLRIYYEKTNDFQKAIEFQKIKDETAVILDKTEANRALFNHKLNKQKELSELKIEHKTRLNYIAFACLLISILLILTLFWNYKNKQRANRLLTEMDELKNRLYSNITHELRTPLTLILGPLEQMLSSETEKIPSRKQVKMMRKNANSLLNLVNQMLDLTKIGAKSMKLELVEEDINKFLRTRFAAFASLAEQKSITYQFSLLNEKNIRIFDAQKLEKIINNLVSNAVKFTRKNGKISCYANFNHHNKLELIVEDNGKGIPNDDLDKIFDRFYQVNTKDEILNIGTGIGLSLTKELIDLMHGKIEVESEPGKGSKFTLTLPLGTDHLNEDEFEMVQNLNQKMFEQSGIAVSPKSGNECEIAQESKDKFPHVLIIEDHGDIREFIAENLKDCFYIEQADNGKSGLESALKNIPDLMITDIVMPEMDGIELCQIIKTDERTSHIPVVILTGKSGIDDRLKGLDTGADAYLTKPFNIKELRLQVSKLIEQRQKLRERFTRDLRLEPRDIAVTSADEKFINRAMEIIEKNIGNSEFEVRQFEEEMFMSRMQLFRKIKALTNQTPGDFMRTIRLKRAASLIKQNFGNIAQITYEVGFNNPSYFAKCFKDLYGELPSDYMKNHRL
jgi:signal transduction histidine kinase/DNA-binding response OmpR family regulator